jgi:hypothetical protein
VLLESPAQASREEGGGHSNLRLLAPPREQVVESRPGGCLKMRLFVPNPDAYPDKPSRAARGSCSASVDRLAYLAYREAMNRLRRSQVAISPVKKYVLNDGLDFGEYFFDAELVRHALGRVLSNLPGCGGFCLRFRPNGSGPSWFEPWIQASSVGIEIPNRVDDDRLIINLFEWPVLATHQPPLPTGMYPEVVEQSYRRAGWRGQMRLEANKLYVGVFKLMQFETSKPVDEDTFFDAFAQATILVEHEVNRRRQLLRDTSPGFQQHVCSTRDAIHSAISAGEYQLALRQLASLITSHLSTSLNHIAFFSTREPDDALHCLYAHGGDGTQDWNRVQERIGLGVVSVKQLQELVKLFKPDDDPYFKACCGSQPLRIDSVSTSPFLMARLWRSGGNLDALPYENRLPILQPVGPTPRPPSDRIGTESLALVLSDDDEWVRCVRHSRPADRIFVSQNKTYYVMPWFSPQGDLIALCLLDQGYWTNVDIWKVVVPRLFVARQLLQSFSREFSDLRNWQME